MVMEADDLQQQRLGDPAAASDAIIADRLDALEAERVLQRAFELEAAATDQPHLISAEQLERIAAEIGMDASFVRQALGEVRMEGVERSRLDRWLLPDPIIETETIGDVSRADLDQLLDAWMTSHEGLLVRQRLTDGAAWDVDRRLGAKIRTAGTTGGNRISRVAAGDVSHRTQSVADDEHVIALQALGRGPLGLAKLGLSLAAITVLLGIVTGLVAGGVAAFAASVLSSLVIGTGIAAAGVAAGRVWARRIGEAFRRSLTGFSTEAVPRWLAGATGRTAPVAEVMASIVERLSERRRRSK